MDEQLRESEWSARSMLRQLRAQPSLIGPIKCAATIGEPEARTALSELGFDPPELAGLDQALSHLSPQLTMKVVRAVLHRIWELPRAAPALVILRERIPELHSWEPRKPLPQLSPLHVAEVRDDLVRFGSAGEGRVIALRIALVLALLCDDSLDWVEVGNRALSTLELILLDQIDLSEWDTSLSRLIFEIAMSSDDD